VTECNGAAAAIVTECNGAVAAIVTECNGAMVLLQLLLLARRPASCTPTKIKGKEYQTHANLTDSTKNHECTTYYCVLEFTRGPGRMPSRLTQDISKAATSACASALTPFSTALLTVVNLVNLLW